MLKPEAKHADTHPKNPFRHIAGARTNPSPKFCRAMIAYAVAIEDEEDTTAALAQLATAHPAVVEQFTAWARETYAPTTCTLCARHYGDGGPCDQGNPANTPHRLKGTKR